MSLDEFKARLPLVEIVARHVRLTRRGREHVGLCPFHHEKTPSFTSSRAKGFYHCFGCGQHGNAIDFVMAIEGLEFGRRSQRLAELSGLPAPHAGGASQPAVDQTLYAANEAAARWFAGRLDAPAGRRGRRLPAGARARSGRRSSASASAMRRTTATRSRRAMLAEGYAEGQLLEAGLSWPARGRGPATTASAIG